MKKYKMSKNNLKCPICKSRNCSIIFSDKIRDGAFPKLIQRSIIECSDCHVQFLDQQKKNKINYEDNSYRKSLNQESSLESFRANHDHLQIHFIDLIGISNIRNKSVLDIGCGGGSFLDSIKGIAKKVSCIEPNKEFQKSLVASDYRVYNDIDEIKNETFDLLTSFHVIEHVEDPLLFLRKISEKMNNHSSLIISTPNLNDILIDSLYEYKQFFYRTAHNYYFNEVSLKNLGERAGLNCKQITYKQRYSVSNFLNWLKEKKPTGEKKFNGVSNHFDKFWKNYLEEFGLAEMIAFEFSK